MADGQRLFFAVWPGADAARSLAATGRRAQANCGGRAMDRDNLHLTLAFLGQLSGPRRDDAMAVAKSLSAPGFDLRLDRLGYWKHNRILWAGGDSAPLNVLAENLARGLRAAGFLLEARPFAAHLTLLRDARCPAVPLLAEAVAWPVRDFVLAESASSPRGVVYRPVGRWPLG